MPTGIYDNNRSGNPKITADTVIKIADTYKRHGYTAALRLQTRLGVSRHTITGIIGGTSWTRITGLPTPEERKQLNGGKPFKRGELLRLIRNREKFE